MAARKMTFSLPEPLARDFLRRVPARERSRFVAEALVERLKGADQALARACKLANRIAGARLLEQGILAHHGDHVPRAAPLLYGRLALAAADVP
jgi:hypothetical protein